MYNERHFVPSQTPSLKLTLYLYFVFLPSQFQDSPEKMPVLITTSGNCLPEDVAYYSSCGADDTFGKPLPNKYDLGRRLLTLLKRKHGAAFIDGNDSPPTHDDKRQRPPPRQSARKRSAPGH